MKHLKTYKVFESSDEELLSFLYILDQIDNKLNDDSDEGWSSSLSYELGSDKIEIYYSSCGYEEGFSENFKVFYKETPIRVERDEVGSTVYGEYDNIKYEKYDTLSDFSNTLKEEFGI